MADRFNSEINRKQVVVKHDGYVWVDGTYTKIKQWDSSSTTWSNQSGQEIKELRGKSLEEVLKLKGYI